MFNRNLKKQKRFNSGFTLVEMLVSIAIFMIVMTVAVGSLISIVSANKKAQAIKNVINNINFALESISKDMRMGTNYNCLADGGDTYNGDCLVGGKAIKYTSNKNKDVYYRYLKEPSDGEGNIQRCIDDTANDPDFCMPTTKNWYSIIAPTSVLNISNMKFYVFGTKTGSLDIGSKKQPRVLITIDGSAGSQDITKSSFNLQTTVSQRNRE